ncbi:unnamed protein product [Zymoseptoria tritici ST99CH_1A5]|uniref:Cyanovirin-N domain-containing protein n=2 Tax=Zymoseptoria tritici TaxID=1047171 RepID=A0A2H1G421_ZYMTR|nr:unnamed protein product [Zymoseptoria tritici ST99CH_1E4]SMR49455.1 unnamed protein product [Zymoseptoria tritici ST99CH_3D1]SMY22152.1 unnamed protein product [Zymoseptoria tritici ST99CH_1A5]
MAPIFTYAVAALAFAQSAYAVVYAARCKFGNPLVQNNRITRAVCDLTNEHTTKDGSWHYVEVDNECKYLAGDNPRDQPGWAVFVKYCTYYKGVPDA